MTLTPLQSLFELEAKLGFSPVLPPELGRLYDHLHFPAPADRPYVIGNFVETLDGVISLSIPGQSGGGPISGDNAHDQMVMGLLRAVADVVIVAAGSLRASPKHVWTPDHVYPALAEEYQQLRTTLKKTNPPLNVIVTARGDLDLSLPVFQSGRVPVLIVTTHSGARQIQKQSLPSWVALAALADTDRIRVSAILEAVHNVQASQIILTEGGPQLMGGFLAERRLDELFLTLAPQVAGRDSTAERPGFVAGQLFAPDHPRWSTLVNVKRGGSHLFLRYQFETGVAESSA